MDSDSDGPEAPKPLTRTADIATPLSRMIRESIEFAYEHRSRFGDEPAEGSRAQSEFAKDTGSPSRHRHRDIEAAHESAAGIYILSAAYFLTALARLLGTDMELFAYQAVARSAVECAAKAWWLDDIDASTDERLARFYADNLDNIDEMAKAKLLAEPELSRRRKELVQRAAQSGIEPKLSKKNELIGFGGAGRIASTTLAGRFFTVLGFEDGDLWYRRTSAVIHATTYGLLDFFQMTDIPGSEFKELHPSLSIEDVRRTAIVSTQAYLGAIEFDCRYFGWECERVADYRQRLLEQMTSLTFQV